MSNLNLFLLGLLITAIGALTWFSNRKGQGGCLAILSIGPRNRSIAATVLGVVCMGYAVLNAVIGFFD